MSNFELSLPSFSVLELKNCIVFYHCSLSQQSLDGLDYEKITLNKFEPGLSAVYLSPLSNSAIVFCGFAIPVVVGAAGVSTTGLDFPQQAVCWYRVA